MATKETMSAQANDQSFQHILDELEWRGLVALSTDKDALRQALASPITFYCGFDPTAPSLHLGNLVQLLTMRRLQLAGHHPLALVGGATGLVGDPKPTAERTLNDRETVASWVEKLADQNRRFLDFEGENKAQMVNNLDWTSQYSAIDFLREIGKHYRVGKMLSKDAVSARLNSDSGISYTEFSYQIMQGLDFLELFRRYGCVLETGGSDQWGNLTSGADLVHKVEGKSVHLIATPLITNSDGKKFGKSEGNAIWLDAELTSAYAMYQFWLNTDDADVIDRLKVFTFLTRAEIQEYADKVAAEPFKREAQKRLALEVTELVHSKQEALAAEAAAQALFGVGDLASLEAKTLAMALGELPHIKCSAGISVVTALVETGLVESNGAARRAIAQGSVSVNKEKVTDENAVVSGFLPGNVAVLARGKKSMAGLFFTSDTP
ncbi:MAG: tyrosine--tRNA ligase [Micrococcales bacterium]|jgi:tyrosyl-tRNA synthetase|nr:tyrosine--tRNA ligase [Micrococcales bacterium]MDG1818197.1 tyrosine--tRNA ligase [Aquiluna sp.]MBT5397776.1 tyrosine--tRNA ligase [Micrococcales bacterium]MBT5431938.1 tyrosine--tRNA ligase [Micrococcales bacterium]MBT5848388.1 tyrosine--tRNA ligase [Micrococcales bacterium]